MPNHSVKFVKAEEPLNKLEELKTVVLATARCINPVWRLHQGQLQMLSVVSFQKFYKECLKYNAPTKAQAGIKVVMKQLYNKVWNGTDWIKEGK